MKKVQKIQVTVGSVEDALDRFEHAWRQAERGGARAAQVRLTFESLPTLLKNLTPARWTLLEQLKREGPLSISEPARRRKISLAPVRIASHLRAASPPFAGRFCV